MTGGTTGTQVIINILDKLRCNAGNSLAVASTNIQGEIETFQEIEGLVENLRGQNASVILDEVLSDLLCAIIFQLQGLYRNAFVSLRSAMELTFGFVYYTDNYTKYLLWTKNKNDIHWHSLINTEDGVTSDLWFSAFSDKRYDNKRLCSEVIDCYHVLSESTHGKFSFMTSLQNPTFDMNVELCDNVKEAFDKTTKIIRFILFFRFERELLDLDEPIQRELTRLMNSYEVK